MNIIVSAIALVICVLFLVDAQREVAKNRLPNHPSYGKGEFWTIFWVAFILMIIIGTVAGIVDWAW